MNELCDFQIDGGNYFGIINTLDDSLMVTIVDSETEKISHCYSVMDKFESIKQFVHAIPSLFKNVKAVTLNIFYFQTSEYSNILEFRKSIKAQFFTLQIPHHFLDEEDFFLSYLINEKIVQLSINENLGYIWRCDDEEFGISDYQYTENGYLKSGERQISASEDSSKIYSKLLGPNNLKQIILIEDSESDSVKRLKEIFDGINLQIIDITEIFSKAIVAAGKCILEKNIEKFVIPKCVQTFSIGYKSADNKYIPLVAIKEGESLPITKNVYISKEITEVILAYHDPDKSTPVIVLDKFPTFHECHQNKFSFTVDQENFPIYEVQRHFINEIYTLPKKLDKIVKSKIPVIGLCDNFSVVCVYNESENGYTFLGNLHGLLRNDLFVSFDHNNPQYGLDAMDKLNYKRSFVVFDLLYIMSMPPENIKVRSHWGFTITKDETKSVLIEFDNFDGHRRIASAPFLMSMFLKENLAAIKNETGQNPKELGFWLFDNFDENEKFRVQKGLKEACKLLKIECTFIEIL